MNIQPTTKDNQNVLPEQVNLLTDDAFLGGELMVLQPSGGYRAGLDAVLLAAAVSATAGRVLDLGAGVGVVGLCVARRLADTSVTLVERERDLVELARRNVARNGFSQKMSVVEGDIGGRADALGLPADGFDEVCANPPYYAEADCRLPQNALRAAAHAMPDGGLDRWARVMARLVRPGGTVRMIHRAEALVEVLDVVERRFGDVTVRPIHARAGEAARRILVSGRKGSKGPLRILPALVLHGHAGNAFRPDIQAILQGPVALQQA